jgi:hypothetical protein
VKFREENSGIRRRQLSRDLGKFESQACPALSAQYSALKLYGEFG